MHWRSWHQKQKSTIKANVYNINFYNFVLVHHFPLRLVKMLTIMYQENISGTNWIHIWFHLGNRRISFRLRTIPLNNPSIAWTRDFEIWLQNIKVHCREFTSTIKIFSQKVRTEWLPWVLSVLFANLVPYVFTGWFVHVV